MAVPFQPYPKGFHAYPKDQAVLLSLGLSTHSGIGDDGWVDLGTVVVHRAENQTFGDPEETKICPATTVRVEVYSAPAQFWRFTVTRPRDEIEELGEADGRRLWRAVYEPVEVFEITTGSGSFSEYWPGVKLVAEHCFEVERVEP